MQKVSVVKKTKICLMGIYLIIIIFSPLIYFFLIQGQSIINTDIISKIDKQFSYISWAVTAITSILAFGVLYLTILLDKNLFSNIQLTKQFYKPYNIGKTEIKNYIYGNSNLKWKEGLGSFFYIFSFSTLFINLFWVTCIGYYGDYNIPNFKAVISFSWLKDINAMSDILAIFVPFTFWVIVSAINIVIYAILIEHKKIIKIKIPSGKERLDISFLESQEVDLGELLFKAGPLLTIYKNYEGGTEGVDLYIEQEVPWKNYNAVFKLYKESKIQYKLYYKNSGEIPDSPRPVSSAVTFEKKDDDFLSYLKNDFELADVSFFSLEGEELARFKLSVKIHEDQKVAIPFRKILDKKDGKEKTRLESMTQDFALEKIDFS